MMTCKTYIGIPHRESVTGQPVVTVCDGQKSEPLPLRLDLFNHSPTGFSWGYGGSGRLSWRSPCLPMLWATTTGQSGCTNVSNSSGGLLAGRGTVVDHGGTDRGRRQCHRAGGCPNSQ